MSPKINSSHQLYRNSFSKDKHIPPRILPTFLGQLTKRRTKINFVIRSVIIILSSLLTYSLDLGQIRDMWHTQDDENMVPSRMSDK